MPNNTNNSQPSESVPEFGDILLQANFDDPQKKQDKEYGRKLMERIFKEQNNQTSTFYFGGRNIRFLENWSWAMGRQNMKEFTDYVTIDGTNAYANVDITQNRTGPQFVETLVNSMSQNEEYPCVTAIDDGSIDEKRKRKEDALYRMHNVQTISQIQQATGVAVEPPNAYVPDDELAAEVHFKLEDRLPKEIEFEEILEKVGHDNQIDTLMRRIRRDLIVVNCGATKIEKLDDGYVGIRKCIPANLVYNFFMSDSGKMELSYIGEVYSLKIRDLRKKYGKSDTNPKGLTEKEIYEMAKTANQYNNSNRFYYYWNDSFLYATDRPYDDYSIQVFDCELKVFDSDYYVSKTDNFGKENIQYKKGIPNPQSDKAKVIKSNKFTVYRGVWSIKTNQMIYWGYPDFSIRPYMDISESLFSYTIDIPNNDGDYVPSLFERALDPLREYQLLKLKRKQLVSEMVPAGYSIDVETARDIDLGGGKVIGWEEVLKIRNQKGVVLWSSRGLNPNEPNREPPIQEMANAGSVAQLNEINNIMAACMMEIRAVLGVPVYRDGSDLKPRMGQAVVENQETNSNNVTDFINHSARSILEETLHKVCILKWDEAVLKQGRQDLMDTKFEVRVDVKPTASEKTILENMLQTAMQENLLSFADAFKVRQIKNYKLAQIFLSSTTEKNKKEAQQAQQQNVEQNAQVQQASAQQAAEQQLALQQHKMRMESEMAESQLRREKEKLLLQGLLTMADTAITAGVDVPEIWKPVMAQMIANVSVPIQVENNQQINAIQAHSVAHQYAMEQMQQGQQQPQGQPQPQQGNQPPPPQAQPPDQSQPPAQ